MVEVVETVVAAAAGKVPVIPGVASCTTADAVAQARACEKLGCDGILAILEAYFPIDDEGVYQYFKAIADAAGLTSVTVTGEAWSGVTTGGHAWNRVLVDGAWLVVDVTWDDGGDPVPADADYLLLPLDAPELGTRAADADWAVDASLAGFGGS